LAREVKNNPEQVNVNMVSFAMKEKIAPAINKTIEITIEMRDVVIVWLYFYKVKQALNPFVV
jgi:hypothetical protein